MSPVRGTSSTGASAGELDVTDWLYLVVPVALIEGLVVGSVRLLRGRSWLVLAVSAGTLAAVPLAAAVLAALPGIRAWVAARRSAPTGA